MNLEVERINQVDLVPTLSTLLGIGIPTNNLGVLIDGVVRWRSDADLLDALESNAEQMAKLLFLSASASFDVEYQRKCHLSMSVDVDEAMLMVTSKKEMIGRGKEWLMFVYVVARCCRCVALYKMVWCIGSMDVHEMI